MDEELDKAKIENSMLWFRAQQKARFIMSAQAPAPAILMAPLFALAYLFSLMALAAFVPELKDRAWEAFLFSVFIGFVFFAYLREKETREKRAAEEVFRELLNEKRLED